jgi:hypothetical protein
MGAGQLPSGKTAVRYKKCLLTKDELAAEYSVSVRPVERWVGDGLPTRNVFGSVRFNEDDVVDWLGEEMGFGCSAQRVGGFRSMSENRFLRDSRHPDWS